MVTGQTYVLATSRSMWCPGPWGSNEASTLPCNYLCSLWGWCLPQATDSINSDLFRPQSTTNDMCSSSKVLWGQKEHKNSAGQRTQPHTLMAWQIQRLCISRHKNYLLTSGRMAEWRPLKISSMKAIRSVAKMVRINFFRTLNIN